MEDKFSTLLRSYRKSMGWTQEELSEEWSYSFETISAWEREKRTPNNHEIPRIAKFLGIDSENLAEIIRRSRTQPLKRNAQTGGIKPENWKASLDTWGELQQIYRSRTDFNQDFSYAKMFENAQSILAAGISLNAITLSHGRDNLFNYITNNNCKLQLCFLDPNGKRCAEREEEENHKPGHIAGITKVSIHLLETLQDMIEQSSPEHNKNLEIRVYDLTPRFNIYIVDDILMTVQSYAYGRGQATPTLLLKRKMQGGLFDFYKSAAEYILAHSTVIEPQTTP